MILLAIYTLFVGLGDAALHIWDEAIYANNALEIALHGDPWILKVDGNSNLYNTKPPLVIWMQAFCIHLFGPNMWAIRLPSAMSSLGVVIMLLFFAKKSLGDFRIGWMTILVLISSIGFVRYHMVRTGDLDATLVFWTTATALLCFHHFLHKKSPWNFRSIAFCILMGYMTKSTAAILPLAGIAIGSLYQQKFRSILRDSRFYTSALCILLFIMGYYLWREYLEAGYVAKVWHSEFQRFTDNIMPWHTKPFSFYFKKLWVGQYFMYYTYIFPGLIATFILGSRIIKHISFLILTFVLTYLLVVSYPHTKIAWYLGPIYPIMSLGVAVVIIEVVDNIKLRWLKFNSAFLLYIPVIYILAFPLQKVWLQNSDSNPRGPLERYGHAIEMLKKESSSPLVLDILMLTDRERHKDQSRFYVTAYNDYYNDDMRLVSSLEETDINRNVLICQNEYLEKVQTQYETVQLDKHGDCQIYLLKEKDLTETNQ